MLTQFSPVFSNPKAALIPDVGSVDGTAAVDASFAAALSDVSTRGIAPDPLAALLVSGKILPVSGKAAAETGKETTEQAEAIAELPLNPVDIAAIPAALLVGNTVVTPLGTSAGLPLVVEAIAPTLTPATIVTTSELRPAVANALAPVALSAQADADGQQTLASLPPENVAPAGETAANPVTVVFRDTAPTAPVPSTAAALTRAHGDAVRSEAKPATTAAQVAPQPTTSPSHPASPPAETSAHGGTSDHASPEAAVSFERPAVAERAVVTPFTITSGTIVPTASDRASAVVATQPATVPQHLGTADAVANVVERLMETRMLGQAAASVSIQHAEFGKLDISFTQPGATLDVSVRAADNENQQALAAALQTGDRNPGREGSQSNANQQQSGTQQRSADAGSAFRGGESQSEARGDAEQRRQHARSGSGNDHSSANSMARRSGDAPASRSGIYA